MDILLIDGSSGVRGTVENEILAGGHRLIDRNPSIKNWKPSGASDGDCVVIVVGNLWAESIDLCQSIRSLENGRYLPIIAVIDDKSPINLEQLREVKVDDVLMWPDERSRLILRLETARRYAARASEIVRNSDAALEAAFQELNRVQRLAGVGSYSLDVESGDVVWSEEYRSILGVGNDTPSYNRFLSLIHPEDRERVVQAGRLAQFHNRPFDTVYKVVRPDGNIRHIRDQGEIEFDDEGVPKRIFGTIHDLTEHVFMVEELRDREKRYRSIVDSSPAGMHMYRLEGDDRLVFAGANPAADRILGVDNSVFVGQTIEEAFPPLADTEIPMQYLRAAAEGVPWQTDQVLYEHGEIAGAFLVNAFQTTPGEMVASFLDMTERVRAENQLRESEERYRNLVETALVGVFRTRLEDGKVLEVNSTGARMTGYSSPAELYADNLIFRDLHLPERREAFLKELREHGKIENFEARWKLRNDQEIYVSVSARLYTEEGYIEGIVIDITERKKAVEKLHRERRLFTAGPVIVFGFVEKERMKMRFVSPNVIHLLGYTADEFVSGRVRYPDVVHPDDYARVKADGELFRASGADCFEQEYRIIRRDGKVRWIYDYTVLTPDQKEGNTRYYQGYVIDATARIEAQNAIRSLNLELEERVLERTNELKAANEELEAFAFSVSHDLRAPLRAIDGFSGRLSEDCEESLTDTGQDYLRRIRRASRRMSRMIDGILQLSRAAREEIQVEEVNLSHMAETMLDEIQSAEPEREVQVIVNPDLSASGDPHLIQQALQNLFDNAWKFTSRRKDAQIEFFEIHNDQLNPDRVVHGHRTFCVRDNGAGFDMQHAHKLFGAFRRLHNKSDFQGTGVGLATVQRIIRRHGGHIWASAEVERGASFFFTLPEAVA